MPKPLVAVLFAAPMADTILSGAARARLRRFARVRMEPLEAVDEAAAARLVRGARGAISCWGTPRLTSGILDRAPDLEIVAHSAGSVKPIVSDDLWRRRIVVTTAAPSIAVGVAEFSLGMIVTGLKRVHPYLAGVRAGGWRDPAIDPTVREFYGISIGVVGAGFVGRHLMKLLKSFSVRVLLHDPYVSRAEAARLGAEKVALDALLRRSDCVTLHAPSIPETRHMIDARALALMKDNAVLVNTARGSLIDEAALARELASGRLFACLDVTDPEPPAADSPLRLLPNVVLTPHIAGAVTDNRFRQGDYAVDELERRFSGRRPRHQVTERMLPRMA